MGNRFNNNWDKEDEDEDNLDNEDLSEEDQDNLENILKQELLGVQVDQVDILQQDVDEKIMQDAIKIASKDWLWYFRKPSTKLKTIKKIYIQLKNIMDS